MYALTYVGPLRIYTGLEPVLGNELSDYQLMGQGGPLHQYCQLCIFVVITHVFDVL